MKFTCDVRDIFESTGKFYKDFEIIKHYKVKDVYHGSASSWYSGRTTTPDTEERVKGSTRFMAWDEDGQETSMFKTIKEVKQAIDNGEYWG